MWCPLFVFQLNWHGRLSLSIRSSLWDLKRPLSNPRSATDDTGNTSETGNTCTISNASNTHITRNDQDIVQVDSFFIQNTTLILF